MATAEDAKLILELYKLRSETVMRESRVILSTLKLDSLADVTAVQRAVGTRENQAWRQVISYWEMAANLVLHGALDAELFLDTNGENFFYYGKVAPFFEEYVKQNGGMFMPKLTKLIETHASYQAKYAGMLARFEAQKKMAAAG